LGGRGWTGSIVELPAGEALELELVEGQSWLAFNYYLGDLRSRIAVNVDLPVTSGDLAVLAAHEAYPGHHTEHALKEARLVRAQGLIEESIAFARLLTEQVTATELRAAEGSSV
jgi:hypothetical protein